VQEHLRGRTHRVYLRCACCGKASRSENFTDEHELQALTQYFTGNGRHGGKGAGFEWDRESINVHELRILADAVEHARERLARLLDAVENVEPDGSNLYEVADDAVNRLVVDGGSEDDAMQLRRDLYNVYWATRRTRGGR
jgi:hypothetical protein